MDLVARNQRLASSQLGFASRVDGDTQRRRCGRFDAKDFREEVLHSSQTEARVMQVYRELPDLPHPLRQHAHLSASFLPPCLI
jgi:hypothetical protein